MKTVVKYLDQPRVWMGVALLLSIWLTLLGVTHLAFEYYTLMFNAVWAAMQECGALTRC